MAREANVMHSRSSTPTSKNQKFKFTPNSIMKLITSTLKHKSYCQPHKQKTQAWKAVAEDLNNVTASSILLYATAHCKIESLLDIHQPKGNRRMRTKFTEEEQIEFSSILDSLYSDYEAHEEEKATKKGEKDKAALQLQHAGQQAQKREMEGLSLTKKAQAL
ncbi:hypothetical protein BT96DRAFT_997279 [Gymnopus androsaceus JB14]|uniref:Myb/SANT-like domain-containing protein n=1 Tax=Gymnopus androsaceus JB14 TaxID=1447944 RepID=A0A6A4HDN4_9AGAR|nr:hypothetical protein BT96DRAFT_997279 [Gymnopus androsaceus JB14]